MPLDADSDIPACSIDDVPGLVWTANLAALELHTPQARAADPWHPTAMVFDLDPGAPADIVDCARVALELRDLLDQLGLHVVAKTSGSKGLHLSVGLRPIGRRRSDQGVRARRRAHPRVARQEARHRDHGDATSGAGKVFVDWSQNDRHKTTVCAYSLRATPRAERVDARRRGTRSTTLADDRRRRRARSSTPPPCSHASTSSATSTPAASPETRSYPSSADPDRNRRQ